MKLLSNRVTNNKISGKFTHTSVHQDFAVTFDGHSMIFLYSFEFTYPCDYLF